MRTEQVNPKLPKEVLAAFNEVRKKFPEVCIVVFISKTEWGYMDEYFVPPDFSHSQVSLSVLEEAVNSLSEFPVVFEYYGETPYAHIKDIVCEHTGGNIYVDKVNMHKGAVICVSDDCIVLYKDEEDYVNNEETAHLYY